MQDEKKEENKLQELISLGNRVYNDQIRRTREIERWSSEVLCFPLPFFSLYFFLAIPGGVQRLLLVQCSGFTVDTV